MFALHLPDIEAIFTNDFPEPIVLVAGGRKPAISWMEQVLQGSTTVWCADSGLVPCLESGVIPERLIGDGDSTPSELWQRAVDEGVSISRHSVEKDLTDLQLALFTAGEELPGRPVLVTGCWGGRFDHLWANIFSVVWAKEHGVRVLGFADEQECMFLVEDGESLDIRLRRKERAVISLLPLTQECSGVEISNVRWELKDSLLLQKHPYTVSNKTEQKKNILVKLQKGILGVYCGWV